MAEIGTATDRFSEAEDLLDRIDSSACIKAEAPYSTLAEQTVALSESRQVVLGDVDDVNSRIAENGAELELAASAAWRRAASEGLLRSDRDMMLRNSVPALQYNVLKMAFEGEDDRVKLDATKFALGQMGMGSITKVDHRIEYEQMPANQLVSIIAGKLQNLQRLAPGLEMGTILMKAIGPKGSEGAMDDDGSFERDDSGGVGEAGEVIGGAGVSVPEE